ncbi:MAG: hypothetical protein OEZ34_15280, partial [Spirochaetia bacterium]|nr:hypothetical protein [Spirochaetia bacterium]
DFNRNTNTLTASSDCVGVGGYTTYASLKDFVDEVSIVPPLPKMLYSNYGGIAYNVSYHSNGFVSSLKAVDGSRSQTMTKWDTYGRPTFFYFQAGTCTNVATVTTYDDVGRIASHFQDPTTGSGTCTGSAYTFSYAYDKDGNNTSFCLDFNNDDDCVDAGEISTKYTIDTKTSVCY